MNDRRLAVDADGVETPSLRRARPGPSRRADRTGRPSSQEEVEARYVAARDAWTGAMRTAQSGRPTDLAALAIAQESYEEALAEKERWAASPRVAVPVETDRPRGIGAVVGQELSWRRVHEREQEHRRQRPSGIRGLLRRLLGR